MNEGPKIQSIPVELKAISNAAFTMRIFVWISFLLAGGLLSLQSNSLVVVLGIIILGIGIAHGVELCHQALHNTGFTSNKLNEIFGIALGVPLLVSFYEYRISHLAHHKYVGTPNDTEYFDYGDGPLTYRQFFLALAMIKHYSQFLKNFALFCIGQPIPNFRDRHQALLRRYYYCVIAFVFSLVLLGNLTQTGLRPLATWLITMLFVAGPIHALIEFPEHYKCDASSKNNLQNTRSIQTNQLMTWFINGNNFHVEHHMHPNVPLQNARKVHDILHPNHAHYNHGYREFYGNLIGDMNKRKTIV